MKPRILFAGPMLGRHTGWVPSPAEALIPRLEDMGYICEMTSHVLNRYARLLDILQTIVARHRVYDVLCLHVYSGDSFIVTDLSSWLARVLKKPVVMVLHGGGLPEFVQKHSGWVTGVLRRAAHIVTPSMFLASKFKHYGFNPVVIPNALDIKSYPYVFSAEQSLGLLWMRTFHPLYNPELAIKTLSIVKRKIPSAYLTMAGQDKGCLQSAKDTASELGLSNSVHFVGFLGMDEKRRVFSNHQVFLNTNRVDNMPVSVVEAAAFGLPVVATSVGGIPFIIQSGKIGMLVPDEDVEAMAQAVIDLYEQPDFARMISQNARNWSEQFDWSRVLEQWDALFSGF